MLVRNLIDEYHEWMINLMAINLPEHRNYYLLMHDLDCKEFYYIHPFDENRDLDGYFLRKEFLASEGFSEDDIWEGPRSVLEVLVAMSVRVEREITGEVGNDHLERWFWVMIGNLGLLTYSDDNYDSEKVDHILDIWLARKFLSNGKNGICPLQKATSDQRDVDFWHQLQLYVSENY